MFLLDSGSSGLLSTVSMRTGQWGTYIPTVVHMWRGSRSETKRMESRQWGKRLGGDQRREALSQGNSGTPSAGPESLLLIPWKPLSLEQEIWSWLFSCLEYMYILTCCSSCTPPLISHPLFCYWTQPERTVYNARGPASFWLPQSSWKIPCNILLLKSPHWPHRGLQRENPFPQPDFCACYNLALSLLSWSCSRASPEYLFCASPTHASCFLGSLFLFAICLAPSSPLPFTVFLAETNPSSLWVRDVIWVYVYECTNVCV